MHDIDWGTVLSTLAGGGAVATLAKALITRALGDLEGLSRKVEDLVVKLAAINVKLDVIDRMRATVTEHERQIAILDARSQLHGEFAAANRTPSNR